MPTPVSRMVRVLFSLSAMSSILRSVVVPRAAVSVREAKRILSRACEHEGRGREGEDGSRERLGRPRVRWTNHHAIGLGSATRGRDHDSTRPLRPSKSIGVDSARMEWREATPEGLAGEDDRFHGRVATIGAHIRRVGDELAQEDLLLGVEAARSE